MLFYSNENTYSVRAANLLDLEEVIRIEKTSFINTNWSIDTFKKEIQSSYSTYLVIQNEKKNIVGYIGCWKILNEGHIVTLAVDLNYRRLGLADILVYSLIVNCIKSDIQWLTLEVRMSNYSAIKLYEKFGFKQLGVRKKYYQDNQEDALILWSQNITLNDYKIFLNKLIEKYSADKSIYN